MSKRGNGEGSIYKRKDGRWVGVVTIGRDQGRQVRNSVYGSSQREVREKLLDLRKNPATETTVASFLDHWLLRKQKTVEPKTYEFYEILIRRHLRPRLGSLPLAKLTPFDVERFYDSATSRAGAVLRIVLADAASKGLLSTNPALRVEIPKTERRRVQPLTQEEIAALLSTASEYRPLYVLALDSGARQGELFALTWNDLDIDSVSIQVIKTLEEINGRHRVKDTKSAASRRRVRLSTPTVAELVAHRIEMKKRGLKTNLMFCDSQGGFLRKSNFLRYEFKPTLRRGGLRTSIRFHDLRHTTATLLLLAGVNPKVVSERLGHARVEVTLNTYSHVLPTMQERAAEEIGKLLHG